MVGARAWSLLAVLAIAMPPIAAVAAEPEPAAAASVAIPDTPAGRRLAWIIEALNAKRLPQPDELRGQFSPRFNEAITVRILRLAREAIAPVSLVGFRDPIGDRAVIALLRDRSGAEQRLELKTDEYSGDRIGGWFFGPADLIGPNQVGVTAWDPARGSPLPGAPIELLDGNTGDSLDPPQRCVGNFLGHCRLTIPDALGVAGIKVSHALLFAKLDSYYYIPATRLRGSDYRWISAFPRGRLDSVLETINARFDPEKGYVSGYVHYADANDHEWLGAAGCAVVQFEPGHLKVLYDISDPARSVTNSVEGVWTVPFVEPGSYVATARVGKRVISMRLPKVVPGASQVLLMPILLDDKDPDGRCAAL